MVLKIRRTRFKKEGNEMKKIVAAVIVILFSLGVDRLCFAKEGTLSLSDFMFVRKGMPY